MSDFQGHHYRRQYRRMQFLLGTRTAQAPAGWLVRSVAGGRVLTAHPDLNVLSADHAHVSITLLGYLLDPDAPTADDSQILGRLTKSVASGGDLFEELATLGGRYLLIVSDGGVRIVGDANGTLQVFHARLGGETWCAAQPDLLADMLGFTEDREATEFMLRYMAESSEAAWPGDTSPFQHVKRLLPNYYLDLDTGSVRRYWPTAPLPQRAVDEVKSAIATRMARLMEAAANRFDLAMGVSAGLDSRLTLAASRSVCDRIVYYTGQSKSRGPNHPDVRIPREMLKALGVEHHIIEAAAEVSEEFLDVYRSSVPYAHLERVPGLQAQHERYGFGRVAVIGNVSENARAFYRDTMRDLPTSGISSQVFADRRGFGHLTFEVRHVQHYLDELKDTNTHGYDELDLLMWEHGSGGWFAHNVTEFLSAWQDVFLPYNCRALLLDMMSAPLASRIASSKELYSAVAAELWPEVLGYPVNPITPRKWFQRNAYEPLRKVKRSVYAVANSMRVALASALLGPEEPILAPPRSGSEPGSMTEAGRNSVH